MTESFLHYDYGQIRLRKDRSGYKVLDYLSKFHQLTLDSFNNEDFVRIGWTQKFNIKEELTYSETIYQLIANFLGIKHEHETFLTRKVTNNITFNGKTKGFETAYSEKDGLNNFSLYLDLNPSSKTHKKVLYKISPLFLHYKQWSNPKESSFTDFEPFAFSDVVYKMNNIEELVSLLSIAENNIFTIRKNTTQLERDLTRLYLSELNDFYNEYQNYKEYF